MSLEKFTREHYPAITIRKNGTVCVNHYAIEQYSLQKVRLVTLHYDPKGPMMGIKPSDDEKDPSAFKVSIGKGRTFTIGCQAFLKHAGISYWEGSKILKADWDKKGKMILVKLQQNHHNPKSPPFAGITIRRNGEVCIHKQTLEDYDLGDLDYVSLEYHPAESMFMITPSCEEGPSPHKVYREEDDTPVVQCQELFDLIGFPYKDGPEKVFKADWDEFTGALLVELGW